MTLLELLCVFGFVGLIIGIICPWLPWPWWASCLGGIGICLLFWIGLMRIGRRRRDRREDRP
jgi:cyanate permease